MLKTILATALVLAAVPSFAQTANNEAVGGGKTSDSKSTPVRKKPVPKRTSNSDKPLSSPCGVYYRNRADMIAESNLADRWFSLGESANKHFWYNLHRTTCNAQSGVLKSWIKEVHKNTDDDYALVLYEMNCRSDQLRVKTVIEYDGADNLLETTNHEDDEPFQNVAPGTAGEVMMRTACRRP